MADSVRVGIQPAILPLLELIINKQDDRRSYLYIYMLLLSKRLLLSAIVIAFEEVAKL
jgi:hypothetical protein